VNCVFGFFEREVLALGFTLTASAAVVVVIRHRCRCSAIEFKELCEHPQ